MKYAREIEGSGGKGRVENSCIAISDSRHIDEAFWSGTLVQCRDRKRRALRHEKLKGPGGPLQEQPGCDLAADHKEALGN